jgi:hypothetical protein
MSIEQQSAYYVKVPYQGHTTISGLVAGGRFSKVDATDATFPQNRDHRDDITMHLLSFSDRSISTIDVLRRMDDGKLRPANVAELLALGAQHSSAEGPAVVALGQPLLSLFGLVRHPILFYQGLSGRRVIRLSGWLPFGWRGSWRFAAVAK